MAEFIEVTNSRTNKSLGNEIRVASSLLARFIGLLGRSKLLPEQGLLLEQCNQVHMFFMRFSISLIFLSEDYRVLHVVDKLAPWQISKRVAEARNVLELPLGVPQASECIAGDKLTIIRKIGI